MMPTNKWNDAEVLKIIRQRIVDRLTLVGEFVEKKAKDNISGHNGEQLKAVDTGNLMNSIDHKVDETELSVMIGTNVEYAPYVEFGTIKMKSRPFLRTAVLENKDQIKKFLGVK